MRVLTYDCPPGTWYMRVPPNWVEARSWHTCSSSRAGPDIPEKLLQAHEEGQVAFFCGAGISYPAKQPGFEGLVSGLSRAERNQNAPGQAPNDESREEMAAQTRREKPR